MARTASQRMCCLSLSFLRTGLIEKRLYVEGKSKYEKKQRNEGEWHGVLHGGGRRYRTVLDQDGNVDKDRSWGTKTVLHAML